MEKLTFTNKRGESFTFGKDASLVSVVGLGDVAANIQTQKSPFQDGNTIIDNLLEERILTMEFILKGINYQEILNKRQLLARVTNPKLGVGTLRYQSGSFVREIKAIAETLPIFTEGNDQRNKKMQKGMINFLCPNPFWLEQYESSEQLSSWIGKVKFPFKFPIRFGEKANRTTINNNGDVETPVIIDFYGPAINPTITNETTGQRIRIKRTLSATDKLEVSTEFGNKYVEIVSVDGTRTNAFHWIDISAEPVLFQLVLGENVISFSSDDSASAGSVNIRYKKRYVAV
jgi:phage-related protein